MADNFYFILSGTGTTSALCITIKHALSFYTYFHTPCSEVRGYTGFTLPVRLSVRFSVNIKFPLNGFDKNFLNIFRYIEDVLRSKCPAEDVMAALVGFCFS
jgi:hypothetical protein